jgi:hypothetical protein
MRALLEHKGRSPVVVYVSMLASIALLLGANFAPIPFSFLSAIYALWLVNRAEAQFIPALFLLYLAPRDFATVDVTATALSANEASTQLLKVWIIGFCAIKILVQSAKGRSAITSQLRGYFLVWLILIPPAAVSTFTGWTNGYENWTRALRFTLTAGCFFYGVILGENSRGEKVNLYAILSIISTVLLGLAGVNWFSQHLLFLLTAMAPPVGGFLALYGHGYARVTGVLSIISAAYFALGSTLTFRSIFLLSTVMSLALVVRSPWARYLPRAIMFGTALSLFSVMWYSIKLGRDGFAVVEAADREDSLFERALDKMSGDRGPIWAEAWHQVKSSLPLFQPSGRQIAIVNVRSGAETDWTVGAHNVFLETMRNGGWLFGGALLIWMVLLSRKTTLMLHYPLDIGKRGLGIASLSAATVGSFLGDYPLDHNVGPLIWILMGYSWVSLSKRSVSPLTPSRALRP